MTVQDDTISNDVSDDGFDAFLSDLTGEDPKQALYRAIRAITSEAEKLRSRRPAAAALLDAQLAGWLAGTAAGLHASQPARRGRRTGMPGPDQLRETFWQAYLQATGEEHPDD